MGNYGNTESVIRLCLQTPAVLQGIPTFTSRPIEATTAIADVAVSAVKVRFHPEWAMELGPVAAARAIAQKSVEFDKLVQKAHAEFEANLTNNLRNAVEAIRRAGREQMIGDTLESMRSVPRSRSLVVWKENGRG